jgi:serine protease Do
MSLIFKQTFRTTMAVGFWCGLAGVIALAQDTPPQTTPSPEVPKEVSPVQDDKTNPTAKPTQVTSIAVPTPEANLAFMFDGSNPTSLEQLRLLESRAREVAEKIKKATVNIRVGQAQGTGIIVSQDGYVLTAAHVIGEPDIQADVFLADGRNLKAKTLGLNRRFDSGMLRIETEDSLPYLDIGESTDLKPGQWVVAIGHPGGLDRERGMVLRMGRLLANSKSVLRTDCVLVGGDSGGPLADLSGNLIGIHSRIGSQLWDNLHVPIDAFSDEWDQLSAGDIVNEAPRPYLGFSLDNDSNVVTEINLGKPADQAGMKKGDKIIKIENKVITNKADVVEIVDTLKVGSQITIFVERDGSTIELKLKVGRGWR